MLRKIYNIMLPNAITYALQSISQTSFIIIPALVSTILQSGKCVEPIDTGMDNCNKFYTVKHKR